MSLSTRLPHFPLVRRLVGMTCMLWSLAAWAQPAEPLHLVVPPFEYDNRPEARYFYQVLELALLKTASEGPFTVQAFPSPMSAERSIEEVKRPDGLINLFWNAPTPARERELLPVRVSLLRELNNYRVFLIRKEDQPLFSKVRTLDDLRKLRAGQGSQWHDTQVLQASGLPVVTSLKRSSLFAMLAVKRFDYFPRGLFEVWAEAAMPENRGLTIENSLMLYYEMPLYFWVRRDNVALAKRLERGLKLAQADGSFDRLLGSVPNFRRGLEEQHNQHRRLFTLSMPPADPPSPLHAALSTPRP